MDLLGGITLDEVTDEEAVLMQGYMDEINKLTKNNSKYLSGGGTNVTLDRSEEHTSELQSQR